MPSTHPSNQQDWRKVAKRDFHIVWFLLVNVMVIKLVMFGVWTQLGQELKEILFMGLVCWVVSLATS